MENEGLFEKDNVSLNCDKCIVCERLGVSCDGPNLLAMTIDGWCEWCRKRKEYLGITNAIISERSGISQVTIDRIMAGHYSKDIMRSTVAAISAALIDSWGKTSCVCPEIRTAERDDLAQAKTIDALQSKVNELYEELRVAHSERRTQVMATDTESKKTIEYLKESINWCKRIIFTLGLTTLLSLIGLIIDLVIGSVGWIRY